MDYLERIDFELRAAGFKPDENCKPDSDEEFGNMVYKDIMQLVSVFSSQGHSGMSAPIAADIFKRLIDGEVLAPLTFADSEWMQIEDTSEYVFQNIRKTNVFKRGSNGRPYTISGRYFSDFKHPNSYYSNINSQMWVPMNGIVPKPIYCGPIKTYLLNMIIPILRKMGISP